MTDTGKRKEIIKSWLGDNDLVFCSILQTRFPRHCFLYYNMTDSPPPTSPTRTKRTQLISNQRNHAYDSYSEHMLLINDKS